VKTDLCRYRQENSRCPRDATAVRLIRHLHRLEATQEDLGAAGVFSAGLPRDAAHFVVKSFGEVRAIELQVDKAVEDAELIVGIACVALLEPVDEGGAGEIGGDPSRKRALAGAYASAEVRASKGAGLVVQVVFGVAEVCRKYGTFVSVFKSGRCDELYCMASDRRGFGSILSAQVDIDQNSRP
jgi:hypothetical protein